MKNGSGDAGPGGKDDSPDGAGAANHHGINPPSADLPMLVEQALGQVEKDRELLEQVIATFVDTAPDLLTDLQSAVTNADAEALRKAAHSLRGAAATIGAEPMRATAHALEQMGQDGALSDVELQVARLYRQFDELKAFMVSSLKDRLKES